MSLKKIIWQHIFKLIFSLYKLTSIPKQQVLPSIKLRSTGKKLSYKEKLYNDSGGLRKHSCFIK